jgi:predicted esterase
MQSVTGLLLLAALAGPVSAQKLPLGPQALTFASGVDDSDQVYGLFLPKNFDENRSYPLIIMLHGAWANHRSALRDVFGRSTARGQLPLSDQQYIVAAPYGRGTMGYQGIAEQDVWNVLADVKRRFRIDEDRIYLTGLSMGGGGTLWLGLSRPDVWTAVAPVCPAPPFGTIPLAPNALNLPVYFFQGDADPVVVPEGTREWVKRLRDLGTSVEYKEYPGVQHNVWENAYAGEFIFQWFGQFKRNRYPERVRFVTDRYRNNSAYWVVFDKLTPGTFAKIDAQFKGPNRLEIATSDLGAFALNLAGHPSFTRSRPVEISIDGQNLTATGDSISLTRDGGAWVLRKYDRPPDAKRPGLEGPMGDIIAGRHIYVFGPAGNPPRPEVLRRRAVAARAAAWTGGMGGPLSLNLRAVPDVWVRPDEDADLVLFGTKETNNVITKLADRLPMHLVASAEEYGLLYLYPVNGHYVLVSSGLSWFPLTDPAPAGPPELPPGRAEKRPIPEGTDFLPPVPCDLTKYPDYLLFKGSPANVVAQGRFDDRWRLPAADAEKLKASGVVTLTAKTP